METRGGKPGAATSPETARASELFDQFVSASTFKSVLHANRQLCDLLRIKPSSVANYYPRLKAKLHSWRAASLWTKLDKRANHKCYNRGKACPNTRVLIIGAGPCGLRAAIEAQLLGAKVVMVEKRDRFSRNNVLHLWPMVIHDLRNLGAKKFFGKFCAGSIDHISIRQLQIILLKVALIFGVEVHENVGFESLIEPPEDQNHERIGWHARVSPSDHPVSQYEFDVLIGADGKRNTLIGFNRKEFRGKLAIAVTANFINRHSMEEARVPEISGVAFIFNQKFFQDMKEQTAIDLENIVYYKDDTHYFVMTAKKQSLLERGVIIQDYADTARLLSAENVDREALLEYARDAAEFATNCQLPRLDFAVNHYGQADVAMFDFTSMYAAENASRIVDRRGHRLLQGLVGDSLLEPFWPTGSGCARGFLSSFDAAWMIRSWASGKATPLQVLAERESIYRLLAQTTPENLSKDYNQYTLNPSSRYPNLNLHAVLPSQIKSLYDTDGKIEDVCVDALAMDLPRKRRKRESIIHPDALLNWCQKQVDLSDKVKIQDFTASWKNGLALCNILHHYRPDLIDVSALDPENVAKNNQLAFDICEKELGISPIMTGQEMAECNIPDKLAMVSYISQVYESFRGEIPVVSHPKMNEERAVSPLKHSTPMSILNKVSSRLQGRRKYSIEKELSKEKDRGENVKKRSSFFTHKRRSRDKCSTLEKSQDIILTDYKNLSSNHKPRESINTRVRNLEEQMKKDAGLRCHLVEESSKPQHRDHFNIRLLQQQLQNNGCNSDAKKPREPKVGKLRKDEWNVKVIEEKRKQVQKIGQASAEKPKIFHDIFADKLHQMNEKLKAGGSLTPEEEDRYKKFDASLSKLKNRLTKGSLEAGEKGHNYTAAMTQHMTSIWEKKQKSDRIPSKSSNKTTVDSGRSGGSAGSTVCFFCQQRIYLMERSSAEGLFFHRSCFKCEYCGSTLRVGDYAFDRDAGGKFYCVSHFRMQKTDLRQQEMMKRKQAFLSCSMETQEKEKLYQILLDNTEKALSPSTKPHSPLLQEPKDQTPERVEYENTLIELSEDELLTSELEEEELTQKNFGALLDLATSEDDYSDLSTDSETDEEAFAEELERSLTADETRKLAETWNQKYSTDLLYGFSSSSSTSADDEGSDTEIGSDDTDQDIDSDAEYSIGHEDSTKQDEIRKITESPGASEVQEAKEFSMEVPVIDLKSMNKVSEDESTTESDVSEEGSNEGSEDESGTEVDSESESEVTPPQPPPQIPTIVIFESPPQNTDLDQEWNDAHSQQIPLNLNSNETIVLSSDSSVLETTAVVESLDHSDLGSKIMDQKVAGKSSDAVKSVMGLDSRMSEEISKQDNSDISNIRDNHNENQDLDHLCLNDGNDVSPVINENLHNVKELSVDHPISNVIKQQESPIQVAINLESVEKEVMKLDTNVKISSKENTFNSITSEDNEQLVFDLQHADEKATILEVKELDFTAVTKTDDDIGLSNKNVLLVTESLNQHKSLDAPLAIGESSSDLSASSSEVDCITKDIACDVLKLSNNSIREEQNPEFVTISDDFSAFESENLSGKLHKSDKILCSTPYSKQKNVSIIDIATPDTLEFAKQSAKIEEIDLCTPSPVNKFLMEKDSDTINKNEVLQEATESCKTKKYLETKGLSLNEEIDQITDKIEHNELNLSRITTVNRNISESNTTVPSMLNKYLSENSDNAPSFITDRKKTHVSSYDWDSDKSISFAPICYQEEKDLLTNDKDVCTLSQSKDNSYNEKTENTCSNDNKNSTPFRGNNKSETSNQPDIILSCMSQSLPSHSSSFIFEDSFPSTPNDIPNVLEQTKTETPQTSSNSKNSVSNLSLESIPSSLKNIAKLTSANLPENNSDSPSNNSLKYKGYSGCFAEKVRPKSLFCDEIYLRSLDIKLQTQPFSSLNKSNDNLDEYHKNEIKDSVRKQLFQENNKNTSLGCAQLSISTMDDHDKNVNPSSSHMQQVKQDNHGKVHTLGRHKPSRQSSVSFTTPDTFGDPVSPYSCNQTSTENAFPTKMTPKCDLDISKLKQKREKRKSVHEDLQGLPFADEEKIVSPIDPLGSSDVFTLPKDVDNSSAQTPTYKMPDLVDEERFLRMQSSVEQEKARQEARARARLKSDEELGLSPNNYRKKYRRQLSLNSINYDELCSDEFCDQDEELEEDTLSNICLTKHSGIEDTFSMLKSADHSCSTAKNKTATVSTEGSTVSSQVTEQTVATETCDKLTKSVDSLDTVTPESVETSPPTSNPEKHSNFATSPESCINVSVSDSKSRRSASVEGSLDEEKSKNSGKKSIFSILNFGKGNISKEKTKHKASKGSEKTLSASLPCDIGTRATPKTKTFTALKLSKSKDKTLKSKAKSVPPVLDNSPTFSVETSALNIHQTVIPKYTVYRNPETSISAFPVHLPVSKFENGLAPKASEDSFSDEDDTQGSRAGNASSADKEREKKAQRIVEKVHKQQILKRLRTAQEIQRRLEELEIHQKELEQRGVQVERALRGEGMSSGKSEADLMQEWCTLVHTKNKLTREIQELLIRLKDLELEDRHSRLQQEITHRMAEGSRKNATQLIEERKILDEMLKIVDKRNELVTVLEQLRLREQEDERTIISDVFTKGMKSTSKC